LMSAVGRKQSEKPVNLSLQRWSLYAQNCPDGTIGSHYCLTLIAVWRLSSE
jgi:hypothetical protein